LHYPGKELFICTKIKSTGYPTVWDGYALSTNYIILQSRQCKFANFAILSVYGWRRDTPTAMQHSMEWACQITSWL